MTNASATLNRPIVVNESPFNNLNVKERGSVFHISEYANSSALDSTLEISTGAINEAFEANLDFNKSQMGTINILQRNILDLNRIYNQLGYSNNSVLSLATKIITNSVFEGKRDLKISHTGDNEILIFREINGEFNNIIIDDYGDIEFMKIAKNMQESYNEHYYSGELGREAKVVSKL